MPEEKETTASGGKPAEASRKLQPTVFTPSAKTVPKSSRGEGTMQSTTNAIPVTPSVKQPTAIPGIERKRLAVSTRDLQVLAPVSSTKVYEEAIRLLNTVVVEKLTERKVVTWGFEPQQAYGALVNRTLILVQSPVLVQTSGYLNRMMEILGSIDLMAICGHGNGNGFLGGLFKGANQKIDTLDELSAAQAELRQIVEYLQMMLRELLDLKDQFEQHTREYELVAIDVEASVVATLFLAKHLQKDTATANLGARFRDQSMSLTQTLAQIKEGEPMRKLQIEQPIQMVGAIQSVVLVMLPGFMSSIAAVITQVTNKQAPNPTEAGEINRQLQTIINQLP